MSKEGGGAAMWVAGAAVAAVMMPFVLFVGVSGGGADTGLVAGGGALNPKHVPPEYVTWVLKAGSMCPQITPPVIAAQIEAESGWRNGLTSPVGAQGLSQFMPGTWVTWGRDDDGNGRIDPFDPGDAIMAQGRYDCALARDVERYKERGIASGPTLDLALAAYNAGPGAIEKYGGIPPYRETQSYVVAIKNAMAKYTAIATDPGGGTIPPGQQMAVPLRGNPPVTSPFGMRVHPVTGVYKLHSGMDFGVGEGNPVLAAKEGTVTFAGWNPAYGNRVIISHGSIGGAQISTTYNHMSALNVGVGQQVGVGTVVGLVGSTGYSTGAHLHFEVQQNGEYVNPAPWIGK
ncbi:peptidoglycan DD-metalloendopeptidase family protein [Streptomyces sp. NPDC096339]|uniref:peptidoglycan DD-metalloendopeptidase family protein n=1 Tax=Streptomyces sp. NPDC096339 TaxID=3366086 RepID=UPI00380817A3